MRRFSAVISLSVAGLLVLAIAASASAGSRPGRAVGAVTWEGESGASPGRTSVFDVRDGAPGQDTSVGDAGYYYFSREGVGSITMDVSCVKVEPGWAEFAGIIEGTGAYHDGEVFLVSLKDGGKQGTRGDEIGMKWKSDLDAGCKAALDDDQFGRKGIITGGNIRVFAGR